MDNVIGIHLGLNYSCIGVWDNGKAKIVPNDLDGRKTPSFVSFTNDERLIGEFAKSQLIKNPENTIYKILKLII